MKALAVHVGAAPTTAQPFPCLKRHGHVTKGGQPTRCRPATEAELREILAALHD